MHKFWRTTPFYGTMLQNGVLLMKNITQGARCYGNFSIDRHSEYHSTSLTDLELSTDIHTNIERDRGMMSSVVFNVPIITGIC
jgi:hypothetical protein